MSTGKIIAWWLAGIVAVLLLVTGNLPGQGSTPGDGCVDQCQDGWMP